MILGTDLLGRRLPSLVEGLACDRLFVLIDPALRQLQAERITALQAELPPSTAYYSLECSGEESKGTSQLAELWSWLTEAGASRQSLLVIIGGGALLDLGGFAAATYMRGIRTINVPTTLLSMVDASVGGKTAIDFAGVKNLVGAFHLPEEVLIDTAFLETLALDELLSGYGEIIKHASLQGEEAWLQLRRLGDPIGLSDAEWLELIRSSVEYKATIVAADPRESGLRRILNAGHTVGHALEAFALARPQGQSLRHGEAVVLGLIVESYLTTELTGCSRDYLRQLLYLAQELYQPALYSCRDYGELTTLMRQDKKNSHGLIRFVGIKAPGDWELLELSDEAPLRAALDFLRETFGRL